MKATAGDESVVRTMLIAIGVALLCSAMVSTAVYVLRPLQAAYAALERNRAILNAAGLIPADDTDAAVVEAFLELDARGADLGTATFSTLVDGRVYDHWSPLSEMPRLSVSKGAEGIGLTAVERYVPVYLMIEPDASRIVLPLHGQGMWSTIYAYLAMESDLRTVAALTVYRHGETPGIGDRIEDPKWLAMWQGKQLFDEDWQVRLEVGEDRGAPGAHQVDAITGATVTSEALVRIVRFWATVYAPLLRQMGDLHDVDGRLESQGAAP